MSVRPAPTPPPRTDVMREASELDECLDAAEAELQGLEDNSRVDAALAHIIRARHLLAQGGA